MKRSLSVAVSVWAIAVGIISTRSSQAAIVEPTPTLSHPTLNGNWIISQTFRPPNLGNPPATAGGATRSGVCFKGTQRFTALLPPSQIGLTFNSHPTFFWYVPQSSAKTAQFLLMTQDDSQVVYETTLTLPAKAGIVSFTLPDTVKPLDVGQRYHWFLTIHCNTVDRNSNPNTEGWVERTAPSAGLSEKIQQTTARDLPALYADQGIWYEALTSLAQLRQANPTDASLITSWERLLRSAGLGTLAPAPIVESLSANTVVK